jgi:hypothetical protein
VRFLQVAKAGIVDSVGHLVAHALPSHPQESAEKRLARYLADGLTIRG